MPAPQTEVLITVDGVEKGRHVVGPGDYIIGRDAGCAIPVDAELVSRQHAMLVINYDHALIEDLGSSNGTSINGQPVTARTRMWPNQKIQIGTATIGLRRLQGETPTDMSLAPAQRAVRDMLPEEMLREKKYDIGAVVARGGMGAILDAREAAIERKVAMKVMLATHDAGDIARFIAEAKVTGQLEHPNIVPIHELGVDENGQPFYTMKMVQGITLKKVLDLMAAGTAATLAKYPLAALLTIFQKVCDALAFAHSKGVVHRDLKPENIMLGDFGEVLVMDWGLAKQTRSAEGGTRKEEAGAAADRSAVPVPHSALGSTLSGTIMGTPQFMAPEQARGEIERIDARSDIYSLGAILYQILALRISVTGTDAMEVVGKVGRGEIEPLEDVTQRRKDAKKEKRSGGDAGGKIGDPQTPHGKRPGEKPFASSRLCASHLPGGRIPDSLAAVVRKAMSLGRTGRYQSVADLQRDIEAYQGGFATAAENAGKWKRFTLFVRRNKAASIGVAAVLLIGGTLGTKALLEGRRAERALADLKASAPALLQLAESEADSQRFPSALGKLDAALALDPALLRARWQRAWVLLALERWSEAADALRLARQHDPAGAQLASILPAVEKVAAAPEAGRWKSDAAREVFAHLQTVEATGPALAFSGKLKLGAAERLKLADQRLLATLGKGNYSIKIENDGLVAVDVSHKPLVSLEGIRGLPIERLNATATRITDLEPLRGMHLQSLNISNSGVTDLTPLRGMSLRSLDITQTRVRDLSPLSGMRLSIFKASGCSSVADLTPLAGMPLTTVQISLTKVSRIEALRGAPIVTLDMVCPGVVDCSPLKGAPLRVLTMSSCKVSDLSFASGMPLRSLHITATLVSSIDALRGLPLESLELRSTSVSDISPLQGAPLKDLDLRACKQITDYTPVLTLPRLERLLCDVLPAALLPLRESKTLKVIEAKAYPGEGSQGARPVAEFWRAYDAWKAKQPK